MPTASRQRCWYSARSLYRNAHKGNDDETRFWHSALFRPARLVDAACLQNKRNALGLDPSHCLPDERHAPARLDSERSRSSRTDLDGSREGRGGCRVGHRHGGYLLRMNLELASLAMSQSMAAATSMLSSSRSRTPRQAFRRQLRRSGATTRQSARTVSRLSGSARPAHAAWAQPLLRARRRTQSGWPGVDLEQRTRGCVFAGRKPDASLAPENNLLHCGVRELQ